MSTHTALSTWRKTPMHYRSLLVLLPLLASGTAAAEPLTEADVVRLAGTRDANVMAAHAAASVSEAAGVEAGSLPNPSLHWEREHLPTGGAEDAVFLTIPLDFTGTRPAKQALARAETSRTRAHGARTRAEAVLRALHLFYGALAASEEVVVLGRTATRLEEASRVVARRHEEGSTSGYELARLQVATELARSQVREAEGRARAARATLAELLEVEGASLQLQGDLTTREPDRAPATNERVALQHWRQAVSDARAAESATRFGWVPELSLMGGVLLEEATRTRYGYVAGLSLSLPVFSRGQGLAAESSARQRLAHAETRAFEREARIDDARAHQQWSAARAELTRFIDATREPLERLERGALSGYREGDRSVVELVDAQRARTDVEQRILALELTAKQAELELRAARGEFE